MSRSKIIEALEKGLEYKENYEVLVEKHSHVKQRVLQLLESSGMVNWTKDKIREEMFKIYQELK